MTPHQLRTRIIATLGPESHSRETVRGLMQAGASIFRSNFAHVSYDEHRERVQWVRELNQELGLQAEVQADIQGTNIRVGKMPEAGFTVIAGETYKLITCDEGKEPRTDGLIPVADNVLHTEVKVGEPITFMDGALEGLITAVDDTIITVEMTNSGQLLSKKSINVPETEMARSSITEKDRRDLDFLIDENMADWVAVSFVGSAADLEEVRAVVGDNPIRLMSKIERKTAIDNLVEITAASDAIMIARGDLGIELPFEEIPIITNRIIKVAHEFNKPVVVATQMMLSMVRSHRPTRAEVSDVANAVFDRADAVMLSEETAAGLHPVHAVETMVTIVRRAEEYKYGRPDRW